MVKLCERTINVIPEPYLGEWARSVRLALDLTQLELAKRCGVTLYEVYLFERNQPIRLEAKIKLLKELRATRNAMCRASPC